MNIKSEIFKLLVKDNGVTRDYPVQAYELEDAINALAKKLNVEPSQIKLSKQKYEGKELKLHQKHPFIREIETISKEEAIKRKFIEKAAADLNALLRISKEKPKVLSDNCLYEIKTDNGYRYQSNILRFRPFYSGIKNNKSYPREGVDRAFSTDFNDLVLEDPSTILMPNTDYVFPVSVKGFSDEESLNKVFRFPSLKACYEFVRKQIIDSGIENVVYRFNKNLTYLEACDSWLCSTGIKMGSKEASKESIDKYNKEVSSKYPSLKKKK